MIKPFTKTLVPLLAAGLLAACLAGCSTTGSNTGSVPSEGSTQATEQQNQPEASGDGQATEEPAAPAELTFDTPFEFDGLSITFGSGFTTAVLENQFSDLNGSTVLVLPMSITNNSDETKGLNMFYYKAFGPSGTQLDDVSSYFMDDDVAWMGELRPGASAETLMHVLYEADGDYFISFDSFAEQIEVKLPITL